MHYKTYFKIRRENFKSLRIPQGNPHIGRKARKFSIFWIFHLFMGSFWRLQFTNWKNTSEWQNFDWRIAKLLRKSIKRNLSSTNLFYCQSGHLDLKLNSGRIFLAEIFSWCKNTNLYNSVFGIAIAK